MAQEEIDEKAIFNVARKIESPDARAEYVRQITKGDQELAERVIALVGGYQQEHGILEAALADQHPIESQIPSKLDGTKIGPYLIREQIGEGGMGVVYVAEQTEPVQRKVALKIIKPGMDTKEVIARFEAERQALAFMEHPNIARVLDAGATENGRSYFVMELVRGIPITEYCDQAKATPHERLELFQTVCDAVQHAHQKGIIHRDIKPSNVLVTQVSAKPVVKVIDFGLAKAVSGQRLTEKTLYTGFMKLMGTPAYMSPEQAGLSGLDIDTRSDIYSLGVVLYELLTGTTPLDKTEIQEQAYDELCRQIREVDAPKPSTRFSTLQDVQRSTIAEHRQVDSRELRQLLHGDLDRVVLKAIEKDRERRYASPQDLAADIDRFLDDKPVLAVPPSQWYLARKYLRRHKTAIVTAATILSVLLLATALSTWQAIHLAKANKTVTLERNAARLAEDEAVTSKRIADAAREASRVSEQQAQASARNERRLRYAANLQLADQLYHSEDGTPEQIEKLLAAWIPSDNEPDDMRELAWRFQWSRLHLSSHKMMEGVNTLTFSPAGNLVLADKSGIREWDPSTRSFSPRWQGDASKGGRQVALSDCGRWAAVRDDSIVRLIELASGESIGEAPGTHARFATGGEYLLVWRIDPEQREPVEHRVWNTKTSISRPLEAELRALGSKSGYENSSSISPDGRSFTFESANGMALEFHVTGRDVPFRFVGDGAGYAAWSPNGQLLAVGRGPGLLVIRRIDDPERNVQLNTGRGGSRSLAFTSDSMQLAVGSGGTVDFYDLAHLYDANAGDETPTMHFAAPPKRVRTVHAHIGAVEKIAFSKDGKFMATVDADRTAKLWQVDQISNALPLLSQPDFPNEGVSGIAVEDFEGGVRVSYVEPFCKASGDFHIGDKILSIAEGGKTQEISRKADANDVRGLLLGAPDSVFEVQLASQSSNETPIIQVTRQKIETLAKTTSAYRMAPARNPNEIIVCSRYGSYRRNLQGNITQYYPAKGPSLVETSPDRKLLAYIERKELVLRDLVNNQEFRRLPACVGVHPTPIDVSSIGGVVSFSPDERFIAVGTGWPFNTSFPERRSDLMVWDTSTFEKIGDPLFENLVGISGVTFSPDSDYLVATDHNGVVRIWRTSDWELVDTLQGLNTASVATSFSPDGEFLGQGGYSGIVVWDFHSRRKLMTNRNRSAVDLEFSQEGTLVTIGLDGRANMWDIHTGMKLTSMKMGPDKLLDCDFTPDRKKLVILGRRDSLWAYDIAPLNEIDQHRLTIAALERRGLSQQQDGMFSKAEGTYRRILRIQKGTLPPGHAGLAETRAKLVNALQQQGEFPSITSHPKTKRVALGEDVTLKVECSHAGETDWTYQWYFKNEPIENATSSSLRIPNVTADDQGVYFVKASCKGDEDLGTIVHTSEVAFIADSKASVVRGGLKKESFFNIESKSLSALRAAKAFPRHPDAIGVIDAFEVPRNVADNYGLRLTGFIVPPKSGNYVFYLCSDDDSELFLSSDETSENRQSIARLSRIRKPREWKTSRAEGISESIRLEAGKRYWVEAHFMEGGGDDHFAVTWQMPDEPPPKIGDPPIPGEFLEFQIE